MLVRALSGGGGTSNPCKIGTFTITAAGVKTIDDVGFKPKQITILFQGSTGTESTIADGAVRYIYDERVSNNGTVFHRGMKATVGNSVDTRTIGTSGLMGISEVNNNGFKYNLPSNAQGLSTYYGTYYYYAIG